MIECIYYSRRHPRAFYIRRCDSVCGKNVWHIAYGTRRRDFYWAVRGEGA